jgi:hypothetical protein
LMLTSMVLQSAVVEEREAAVAQCFESQVDGHRSDNDGGVGTRNERESFMSVDSVAGGEGDAGLFIAATLKFEDLEAVDHLHRRKGAGRPPAVLGATFFEDGPRARDSAREGGRVSGSNAACAPRILEESIVGVSVLVLEVRGNFVVEAAAVRGAEEGHTRSAQAIRTRPA